MCGPSAPTARSAWSSPSSSLSGGAPACGRGSARRLRRPHRSLCHNPRDFDTTGENAMALKKTKPAGAKAGVAFVECDLINTPSARAQVRRREVVVNGRRVKTVDVHAHCAVPEAMAVMGKKVETRALLMSQTQDRLRAMDEQGIDVEALSINPYWYEADRDV